MSDDIKLPKVFKTSAIHVAPRVWDEIQAYARAAVIADREGRKVAGLLREPVNGEGWSVHWWNESMRLMLPDGMRIDHHQHYKNGTIQLTMKADAQRAKETT